ncbi:MAG: hypothetical protein CMB80_12345 [Flammeovirgaceae bacterium]|nr:hypothetical protein [Flammeovirgaceae bacterium]
MAKNAKHVPDALKIKNKGCNVWMEYLRVEISQDKKLLEYMSGCLQPGKYKKAAQHIKDLKI